MEKENEIIVEQLLSEFKEQRDSLKLMIKDLEVVKEKIDNLFPEGTLDKRYSRFFEEKVKSATGIFSALLDIRKEITKSLKDEIELRRKLTKEEKESAFNLESLLDIGNLASKVEKLQKINKPKIEKVEKAIEKEEVIIDIKPEENDNEINVMENIKNVRIDDPIESLKIKMGLQ